MFRKNRCLVLLFFGIVFSRFGHPAGALALDSTASSDSIPTYVTLWFDTEDFILPASDDAAMRLAIFLHENGIKATFKVVGEKARTLERRGRQDVIAALCQHDIGYHSNWHSVHPTPAERLSRMGWEEGIREFERTERAGFEDVRRIFQQEPVCYGQPGASWAPQPYATLRQWGVALYLDESRHLGLNQEPFWYGGLLNVLNLGKNLVRVQLRQNTDLETARSQFEKIYGRLQAQGGGLVSIYYHPCEFVHEQFWDAVNFRRGTNPSRREWRLPPVKNAAAIELAFKNFQAFMIYLKNQPGVRFKSGRELLALYPDKSMHHSFSKQEVLGMARAVQNRICFHKDQDYSLSSAEIFSLLNAYLSDFLKEGKIPERGRFEFIYGPPRMTQTAASLSLIDWEQFAASCMDVQAGLDKNWQMPAEIWSGADAIAPADYLATLGRVVTELITSGKTPEKVALQRGQFIADQYVAHDSKDLWGWIIFPEGFHSPQIMEQARLQAWTLKPALLGKNKPEPVSIGKVPSLPGKIARHADVGK